MKAYIAVFQKYPNNRRGVATIPAVWPNGEVFSSPEAAGEAFRNWSPGRGHEVIEITLPDPRGPDEEMG